MSTVNKNTVAAVRAEAEAQFEQMKAELEAKTKELDSVKAELEAKTKQDEEHTAEIEALKKNVRGLEDKMSAAPPVPEPKAEPQADGLIEIVAVPDNPNAKVFPLVWDGKDVLMKKDEDGFYHFFVARKMAEEILASQSGMKYRLIGPDAALKARRMTGIRSTEIVVRKHVKDKTSAGTVFWKEVIEE
ncbi:MAG: hypothetical protein LBB56_04705 [Chitinispirillales bacterium]|jgi:hypothetical protein|nr:hypothetical protein [Chitinispirillales bacterium]